MDIIEKIDGGYCSSDELEQFLEQNNPIILYHTMIYIGKHQYYTQGILEKLNKLCLRRTIQDKLVGYYKIGDLAMATLMRIKRKEMLCGIDELDDFEKKMIMRLFEEVDW